MSRRKQFVELEPELRARIEEMNQVDLELWRYADALFETRTKHFALPEGGFVPYESDHSARMTIEEDSIEILNVSLTGQTDQRGEFLAGELATLSITFRALKDIENLNLGYSLHHDSGLHIFGVNTRLLGYELFCQARCDYRIDFSFAALLGLGTYYINISARSGISSLDHLCLLRKKSHCSISQVSWVSHLKA